MERHYKGYFDAVDGVSLDETGQHVQHQNAIYDSRNKRSVSLIKIKEYLVQESEGRLRIHVNRSAD